MKKVLKTLLTKAVQVCYHYDDNSENFRIFGGSMLGTVFNIQRFSLFDGPGVRTVVFFKGCPLRCIWCHNPEGIKKELQVMFDPKRCIGCGECASVCPQKLHVFRDGLHGFIREGCTGCGKCTDACCTGALSMAGELMDSKEVIDSVMRDSAVFKESGGGVTLSGGEPLFQPDFALEILREAKDRGISTAIETSGFGDPEKLRACAEYIDVFLFDYKATGDEMHKEFCGVPQSPILKNLSLLDEIGANVVLRCPIITGKNDIPEHIAGIAATAKAHSSVHLIQLEPYHKLGISKSDKLGEDVLYDGAVPARATLEAYCAEISAASGKECTIS